MHTRVCHIPGTAAFNTLKWALRGTREQVEAAVLPLKECLEKIKIYCLVVGLEGHMKRLLLVNRGSALVWTSK
jgi:fructose-1,6-bisphosphatase/sedoheptulose 1,7-bisphosphatase-like protein